MFMKAKFYLIHKISTGLVEFCNTLVGQTQEMHISMKDGLSMVFQKEWEGKSQKMELFTMANSDLD